MIAMVLRLGPDIMLDETGPRAFCTGAQCQAQADWNLCLETTWKYSFTIIYDVVILHNIMPAILLLRKNSVKKPGIVL